MNKSNINTMQNIEMVYNLKINNYLITWTLVGNKKQNCTKHFLKLF